VTLIATPGAADANSYLTVAAADALRDQDFGPEADAWLKTDATDKEAILQRATREVDGYMRSGYPETSAPLLFPRGVDVDDDGEPYLPRAVVLATYQQAIFLAKNATVLAAANTRRARNVQSASEPDVSYTQGSGNATPILSDQARLHADRMRATVRGIASVKLVPVEGLE